MTGIDIERALANLQAIMAERDEARAEVESLGSALMACAHARADAEARLAAVRALHVPGDPYYEPNGETTLIACDECEDDWPCATVRALDGTPTEGGTA